MLREKARIVRKMGELGRVMKGSRKATGGGTAEGQLKGHLGNGKVKEKV